MDIDFLAIVGPTATGKSDLAIMLAKHYNSVIISMDSMQIYKRLNIGTAKLSLNERENIAHYMIDIIEPNENYSVEQYTTEVSKLINIYKKKKIIPIIVGGTGLYLKSLLFDYSFGNIDANISRRNELYSIGENIEGKLMLHQKLTVIDPITAKRLHYNDIRRIVRAIEVYESTGIPLSSLSNQILYKYNPCIIALNDDRSSLYKRINNRVDKMIKNGLFEEVSGILNSGVQANAQSMQGIGYKEIVPYLNNKISADDSVNLIKLNSRHYAKRQITFFKAIKNINWININENNSIFSTSKLIFDSALE